ncbi:uncharacterized protein Girdinl1 isoform X5 [Rattus norvegicus]|uniref:uncharacterized protein Girdinl1 isoform X5 n=1 Tax=Rattus norvegicus TaxID=10116 RepID=UPI002FD7D558
MELAQTPSPTSGLVPRNSKQQAASRAGCSPRAAESSIRHSQLLREKTQLKNNIQILLNEKSELLVEQTELPASSVEAKRLCEEAGMNIYDPRAKQQQV